LIPQIANFRLSQSNTIMSPVQNGRVIFNEVPTGYPDPQKTLVYDTSETIDLESVALNGGILVKTLVVSVDPYFRGRLRSPENKSYNEAFVLGETISSYSVGVVLRSETPDVEVGEHLVGHFRTTNRVPCPQRSAECFGSEDSK